MKIKVKSINKYLDTIGKRGSLERLEAIANLNLGKRSIAAKQALIKKQKRLDLKENNYICKS